MRDRITRRTCTKCGKFHACGLENTVTGEFQLLDKCKDCLMSGCTIKYDLNIDLTNFGKDVT